MIHTAALIAFVALLVHGSTREGMILERVRSLTFRWPPWLTKPLYDCPVCMAPWLGAILYASGVLEVETIGRAVLTCLAAGGINFAFITYVASWPDYEQPTDPDGN